MKFILLQYIGFNSTRIMLEKHLVLLDSFSVSLYCIGSVYWRSGEELHLKRTQLSNGITNSFLRMLLFRPLVFLSTH